MTDRSQNMANFKKIGILTSGGDAPGMNAAVVSVARCAAAHGIQLMGIKRGYNGTLCLSNNASDDMIELDLDTVLDIADLGGTFLRTARCLEFMDPAVQKQAVNNLRALGIEGLVCIGGDGQVTMGQSTIMKASAKKIRKIYKDTVVTGFAYPIKRERLTTYSSLLNSFIVLYSAGISIPSSVIAD